MKRLITILVAFMFCISFTTVTYATDINLDLPDTSAQSTVESPTVLNINIVSDIGGGDYVLLRCCTSVAMAVTNFYTYSKWRADMRYRCCNSNSYQMINDEARSSVRYTTHTKAKATKTKLIKSP